MRPRGRAVGTGGYRPLLRYPARQWRALVALVALNAATAGVAAALPLALKLLVDNALGADPAPPLVQSALQRLSVEASPRALVLGAAGATLVLMVLNSALTTAIAWRWSVAGQRMIYDLAGDLFDRLQRLSLRAHSGRSVGDSLSRITIDTWSVYTLAEEALISPAQHVLTVVFIGVVAWSLDPGLALVALTAAPLLAASTRFFGKRIKHRARRQREAHSRLLAFVQQTLTAIPMVQAFAAEPPNRRRFAELAEHAVVASQRNVLLSTSYRAMSTLALSGGTAVVLYAGSLSVLSGSLSLGTLLAFVAYLRTLQKSFDAMLTGYAALRSAAASADRVVEVLDLDEDVRDRPGAVPVKQPCAGHVLLDGVSFGYAPDSPVLHDVTVEARPGQTVALVGRTGAGKSTLVSLIPRFFDPSEGRVTLDGVDVRDLQLSSLRAQIALVLQEPFLLPLSVAENIAYGRRDAHRDEVVAAATAANAHEFICRLPEGYETVLGERGATLSGGERQRISIARALLKDAPVLILDEPTAALDAATEASLMEAVERLTEGRTTFIIAHRLSTIRRAQRVVVLDEGRVVEQGRPADMLAAAGAYRRLYDLQFSDRQEVNA
jgi:ATP-binding cassette subfamily B protein